jgi:hypothetical protein
MAPVVTDDDLRKGIRQGDDVKVLKRKLKRRPVQQPAAGAGLWKSETSHTNTATNGATSTAAPPTGSRFRVSPKEGQALLSTALRYDRLQIAEYLITKHGISVSGNALAMALSADMVHLLVQTGGADVNQTNPLVGGTTPLHAAQNTQVLVALLREGADPTIPDTAGNTPLHLFAFTGKLRMMQVILLNYHPDNSNVNINVNIDARNNMGFTPLHCAVERGFADCAKALVQAGANPRLITTDGQSVTSMIASLRKTKPPTDWSFVTQQRRPTALLSRAQSVPALPLSPGSSSGTGTHNTNRRHNATWNTSQRSCSVVSGTSSSSIKTEFVNEANSSLDESKLMSFGGGKGHVSSVTSGGGTIPRSPVTTVTKQVSFRVPHNSNENKVKAGPKQVDVTSKSDSTTVIALPETPSLRRSASAKKTKPSFYNSIDDSTSSSIDEQHLLPSPFQARDTVSFSLLPGDDDGNMECQDEYFGRLQQSNRSLSSLSEHSVKATNVVEAFRNTAIKASKAAQEARMARQKSGDTGIGITSDTVERKSRQQRQSLEGLERLPNHAMLHKAKTDSTTEVSIQSSVSSTSRNMTESSTELAMSLSIPNRIQRLEDLLDCHSESTDSSSFVERLRKLEIALSGQVAKSGGVLKRLNDLDEVVFGT